MRRRLRHFGRDERGVAALEAALLLPFVLILGMGAIEFGWVMAQVQSVQTALRVGARYASRTPLVKSGDCFVLSTSANAAAAAIIDRSYQSNGITGGTRDFPVSCIPDSGGPYYCKINGTFQNSKCTIKATASFTPVNIGMLRLVRITLPRLTLNYQVRHVGG